MKHKIADKLRHQAWVSHHAPYLLPPEATYVTEAAPLVEVIPSQILLDGVDVTAQPEDLSGCRDDDAPQYPLPPEPAPAETVVDAPADPIT